MDILWVAAALLIGFILGAIEGRNAVARAQEIAKAADSEAEAIREATSHALSNLQAQIELGAHEAASELAHIVALLRGAL